MAIDERDGASEGGAVPAADWACGERSKWGERGGDDAAAAAAAGAAAHHPAGGADRSSQVRGQLRGFLRGAFRGRRDPLESAGGWRGGGAESAQPPERRFAQNGDDSSGSGIAMCGDLTGLERRHPVSDSRAAEARGDGADGGIGVVVSGQSRRRQYLAAIGGQGALRIRSREHQGRDIWGRRRSERLLRRAGAGSGAGDVSLLPDGSFRQPALRFQLLWDQVPQRIRAAQPIGTLCADYGRVYAGQRGGASVSAQAGSW